MIGRGNYVRNHRRRLERSRSGAPCRHAAADDRPARRIAGRTNRAQYIAPFVPRRPAACRCAGWPWEFVGCVIIDVAGSHQPLANEDGTIWAVFNGEIYNFRQLRRRLEGSGHRFRTSGDAESIVRIVSMRTKESTSPGICGGCLPWRSGMPGGGNWSWARDRLGKKPLVYLVEANRLLFASELKSILCVPGVPQARRRPRAQSTNIPHGINTCRRRNNDFSWHSQTAAGRIMPSAATGKMGSRQLLAASISPTRNESRGPRCGGATSSFATDAVQRAVAELRAGWRVSVWRRRFRRSSSDL